MFLRDAIIKGVVTRGGTIILSLEQITSSVTLLMSPDTVTPWHNDINVLLTSESVDYELRQVNFDSHIVFPT